LTYFLLKLCRRLLRILLLQRRFSLYLC